MVVSQYDIDIKGALIEALSPPILQFAFRSLFIVSLREHLLSALFHSNPTNCDRVANWRTGGKRAFITASSMYISCCDTITTQILDCSQSTDFGRIRLCSMINPAKNHAFMSGQGTNPAKTKQLGFLHGSGTGPNLVSGTNPDHWRDTRTRCKHYRREISTGKQNIHTMDCSKDCAKNKCNTIMIA